MLDKYISTNERTGYIKNTCEEICYSWEIIKKIDNWYKDMGLPFMVSSDTNYRDALFHFRKLFYEKSLIQVAKEEYALEEHLHRMSKDLIVNFFQRLSSSIEKWNEMDGHISKREYEDLENELEQKCIFLSKEENWVRKVFIEYDEDDAKNICKSIALNIVNTEDNKKVLQKNMHSMKDVILELRYTGAKIERPLLYKDNLSKYEDVFMAFTKDMKKIGMYYLISSAQLILGS